MDRLICNNSVPLKMSFFAWKVVCYLVPLDANLKPCGISLVSRCSCYLSQEESLVHLLVMGPVAIEVWGSFQKRFEILESHPSSVLAMVLSWFDSNCLVMRYHIRAVIPVVVLWFLWKSRKKNMF